MNLKRIGAIAVFAGTLLIGTFLATRSGLGQQSTKKSAVKSTKKSTQAPVANDKLKSVPRQPVGPSGKKIATDKLRRQRDKTLAMQHLRRKGGAPVFSVVAQLADKFQAGKPANGPIELAAYEEFRRAKPQAVQRIAAGWRGLSMEQRAIVAGPELARKISPAESRPFTIDDDVKAVLTRKFPRPPARAGNPPVGKPGIGPPVDRKPVAPKKTGVRNSNLRSDATIQLLDSAQPSFSLAGFFQPAAPETPPEFPVVKGKIRQVLAKELKCVTETGLTDAGSDTVFISFNAYYTNERGEYPPRDVIQTLTKLQSDTYRDLNTNDPPVSLNAYDALVLDVQNDRYAAYRPHGEVEISAVLWETDEDDFTISDVLGATLKVAYVIGAGVVQAETGIPVSATSEIFFDLVDGLVAELEGVDIIDSDTIRIVVQELPSSGAGAPAQSYVWGTTKDGKKYKNSLHFKGLGGEYFLRDFRIVTDPPSGNSGKLPVPPRDTSVRRPREDR